MSDVLCYMKAGQDFDRALVLERITRTFSLLNSEKNELLSLRDVKSILKPKSEYYRGMKTVTLSLIVGSEGRYGDFNKTFLPKYRHLRGRWTRVNVAHYQNITLPPVKLYEIGGVYFVRDGNHRVSVAKRQGVEFIDAEVISLDTEVKLSPDMTKDDLKKAVIAFERQRFFTSTGLDKLKPGCCLNFTEPGRYDDIITHINCHKYYLNLDKEKEIPFKEAMLSWCETVCRPILHIIQEENILSYFPGRTAPDLYVWIVRHWDELKRKYGNDFPIREAAQDFKRRYGKSRLQRLKEWLVRIVQNR